MARHGLLDDAEVVPFGTTLKKVFAERTAS
jgi:hypothetical protein